MPEFSYVAQTNSGAIEHGRMTGLAPSEVREKLIQRGCRLVGIREEKGDGSGRKSFLASFSLRRFRSVRSSDIELLLQQLAAMLESGLELTPSLRELSLHSPRRRYRRLCRQLAEAIEQGKAFSTSLSETQSFPPVVIQLTRVGEESGELAITLQRAAEFLENRRLAVGNLLSALAYPLLVAIAACAVATYLVGWAIPKLALFLYAMGRKLPAMTQSLLDISSLTQTYGFQLVVMLVTGAMAVALIYAWRPGRHEIDRAMLRLPLIGSLMQMTETHQFASSLALMLRSGVLLPEALEIAATLHHNHYLAFQVARAREELETGKTFAGAFRNRGFGPMLPSMIAVGERTGNLPKALEHVAKFYAVQVDIRLKRIGRLIEPAIIVIVGGMVGYVYIAFFMALLSAGGNFQ